MRIQRITPDTRRGDRVDVLFDPPFGSVSVNIGILRDRGTFRQLLGRFDLPALDIPDGESWEGYIDGLLTPDAEEVTNDQSEEGTESETIEEFLASIHRDTKAN